VAGEPEFRTDLYRGTAPFYDRFRPPYPDALMDDLRARLPVSGTGRLLDLACGTGQIAFPMAPFFEEVVAVDQENESVTYGRAKAQALHVGNITWVAGAAERVELDGLFELIAVGNAFHRLDRTVVARRRFSWLAPQGGVALLWGGTPWHGDQPWQRAIAARFEEWMRRVDATNRVPAGWEEAMAREPHDQVLRRAGFDDVGRFEFPSTQSWDAASLCGFVYSTSFWPLGVLGAEREAFERDIAGCLQAIEPAGAVTITADYSYDLARKPG
jgi:SAM-dependent methyltransferase